MKILENHDLTKLNTFGVKAKTKFFAEINSEEDIKELFNSREFRENGRLFLGGGSNVLFTKDFDGIVILNKLKGIEIIKEDSENVWIKSMGGEWWNDLVNFAVDKGLWGIENMALIPGTVGASPVQNIGAYGVEIKDVLESVEAYEIESKDPSIVLGARKKIFSNGECEFGYRESIFKNKQKGKYFISAVILKLNKKPAFAKASMGKENKKIYPSLEEYIEKNKIEVKSVKDISDAVSMIRKSKLPDPKVLGSAGSFFKNAYVEKGKLKELQEKYPNIPNFLEDDLIKIPTGWLVEQCGPNHSETSWKGYRQGNVGIHEKQALVLVNYGGATGEEIKNLAEAIINSVYEKFGIKLTPEVNFI